MGQLLSPRPFALFLIAVCTVLMGGKSEGFLDGGIGARSTGLGEAFVSVADDPDAVFANPAGLAQIGKKEVVYTNVSLFLTGIEGDDLSQNLIAVAVPLSSSLSLGLGYQRVGSNLLNENGVAGSLAFKAGSRLNIGATANLLWWKVGEIPNNDPLSNESKMSIGADAGLLYSSPLKARLGVFLKNINQPSLAKSAVKDSAGNEVPDAGKLPFDLHIGVSYPLAKSLVSAELAVDDLSGGKDKRLLIGGETELAPGLSVRAGGGKFLSKDAAGERPLTQGTLGIGYLAKQGLKFDYSYNIPLELTETNGTHRFSLGYQF